METSGSNSNLTSALLELLVEQDEEQQVDMSDLYTQNQEKLLFWIGKPTTVLGMLGSAYVCFCIIRSDSRQVFRRFLLCGSAGHLALCVCMALSTIPTPKSLFYGSMGNQASCQAAGFLTHLAFGFTMFYHAAMGFYYIFIFFRGWTERQFVQKIEPVLHGTAILFPLTGAIVGISTRMYGPNQLLLLCWVETGKPYRSLFVWLCGLIELNYFTVFKQMALVAIAVTVYRQERKMNLRYSVNNQAVASAASKVTRETLIQATLYFLSCFIPYALMMIMRYFDLYWKKIPEDGKVPSYLFGLAAAAQFLYPLQGIFTMTGFLRPDYLKRAQKFPKETTCQSIGATMWYQLGFATLHHDYERPSSSGTESDNSRLNLEEPPSADTFRDEEPQGEQGDDEEESFDAIAAC